MDVKTNSDSYIWHHMHICVIGEYRIFPIGQWKTGDPDLSWKMQRTQFSTNQNRMEQALQVED